MVRVWGILACVVVSLNAAHAQDANVIGGTVADLSGAAIAEAQVTLYKMESSEKWSTSTNTVGYFEFAGLSTGEYSLDVSASGFKRQTVEGIRVNGMLTSVPTIRLQIGLANYGVPPIDVCKPQIQADLVLPRVTFRRRSGGAPAISGSVARAPNGFPDMAGVRIVLTGRDRHAVIGETKTDQHGAFEFRHVPPGEYAIRASLEGYADFVVNDFEVRADHTTQIASPLEMDLCPTGVTCTPSEKVHVFRFCP